METLPGNSQSYPPPPPPQRSRKGLWIGLTIGAVVLCLCCIIIVVGVYFFGPNIPFVPNFLSSPTPIPSITPIPSPTVSGLFYNNHAAGISLTYPVTWQYSESGDATNGFTIIFASSAEVLNNLSSGAPASGATMVIMTNSMTTSDIPFTVNESSMGDVLDYIAAASTNLSGEQALNTFTLSGYPAASAVFTMANDTGIPSAALVIVALRNEEIILFLGVCPQTEWSQHKYAFAFIENSVIIVSP